MLLVNHYFVVNGSKSNPFTLNKELESKNELEMLRKELEEKHNCFRKTIMGKERVSNIFFEYKEKVL